MTTAPHVPAPPPGPGVQPPFPAPPVEGRGQRLGLSLGIGLVVLLLVCGGGAVALVGLFSAARESIQERARAGVSAYFDAVRDRRYDQAYDALCSRAQRQETRAEFRQRITAEDSIESYTLGRLDEITLAVPVQVTYAGGEVTDLDAYLDQDPNTGDLEVCELEE